MENLDKLPSCSEIFLYRMSTINPEFSVSAYFAKFKKLETNMERVKFVYKDLKKHKLFPKISKFGKDDNLAREHRQTGNKYYKDGQYEAAFQLYSDGLLVAKTTKELGLMYANRSACLFKMKKYEECVVDINRAFENNYSGNLRIGLYARRCNAQKLMRIFKKDPYHDEIPMIPTDKRHPHIQSASDGIAIETNEKFGKHVVARRDIKIGELLCVEKAFVSFFNNGIHKHCHFCSTLCCNPIPCKNCGILLFCSDTCRDAANNSYHKYECLILGTIIHCGMDYTEILALRVAILARPHFDKLESLGNEDGLYRSDRYKEMHNIDTEVAKRPMEQLFQFALAAAHMHFLLSKKTSFFNGISNKEAFVDVIFRQLLIASIHKLPIQEDIVIFDEYDRYITAWGLYPLTSFFKHSCCPNVANIQYGSTMVLRSLATIKKGEQCFISHGVTFQDDMQTRLLYLSRLFVTCDCLACKNYQYFYSYIFQFERPIFSDLEVNEIELLRLASQVLQRKVDMVKGQIPVLKRYVRKLEEKESWGNLLQLQNLLSECYILLGNKRYV